MPHSCMENKNEVQQIYQHESKTKFCVKEMQYRTKFTQLITTFHLICTGILFIFRFHHPSHSRTHRNIQVIRQVYLCVEDTLSLSSSSRFLQSRLTSCCTCCHFATSDETPFFFKARPGANLGQNTNAKPYISQQEIQANK